MTEKGASTPGTGEGGGAAAIRVILPQHLRTLTGLDGEVALELREPVLRGTIREYGTGQRRAFLRFFACETDWTHEGMDAELPAPVAEGREPLLIIGAIAGG